MADQAHRGLPVTEDAPFARLPGLDVDHSQGRRPLLQGELSQFRRATGLVSAAGPKTNIHARQSHGDTPAPGYLLNRWSDSSDQTA